MWVLSGAQYNLCSEITIFIPFSDSPGCAIQQSEDDGDIILECVADANPNDVTVSCLVYE